MRSSRITTSLALFLFVLLSLNAIGFTAEESRTSPDTSLPPLVSEYHGSETEVFTSATNADEGGIREVVPAKYAARYLAWKKDFLSSGAGREQWAVYENNPHFTLTITVSRENAEGAATGKYRWDQSGQLVAATITLGSRLDNGYPNPIYFPVMNSLMSTESIIPISGNTLAATKLAHEFGHVIRTSQVDAHLYQLQAQLIPQYNKIFLANGRKAADPKLIELVSQMGGTPVTIWEDREYWGETNAMLYLRDRITENNMRCSLFNRIRHSIDLYAKPYQQRFLDIAHATPSMKLCGWQ
jgi:YD repeat-containing protein